MIPIVPNKKKIRKTIRAQFLPVEILRFMKAINEKVSNIVTIVKVDNSNF